jgi:hypothetical protein
MAVGFPTKANWAAGDMLTASAMDDLAGTVNTVQYLKPWNQVLNSNMSCWQRGTSFTVSGAVGYGADRWYYYVTANGTISRQTTIDTTNLPFIQYCQRFQRTAGNTGTGLNQLSQSFESVNSISYAGKIVTLSFYARAGANFSAASSNLACGLISGTGTDQNVQTGFTGSAYILSQNATLTTTWQRFSYTGTVPASSTQLGLIFGYSGVGTAGANDYFEITGVQLEQGSVANTYQPNQATYQGELAACQRYYFRSTPGSANNIIANPVTTSATTATIVGLRLPVTMRTAPSSVDYSSIYLSDGVNAFTSLSSVTSGANTDNGLLNITTSGLTQYRSYNLQSLTSSGYVGFSAEL